jgi:hypothetical protein
LKWLLAFLVGFLTGLIATLINLAVENIAGYKFLVVLKYINTERLDTEQSFLLFLIFKKNLTSKNERSYSVCFDMHGTGT